ncbi:uncharacterized protein PAC_04704 [Phialocephala subalpina]|uniref:Uncharacterized protein n=1 Tax=Phialocephala subalpina TaxID=576137 RepID=A0A1L7WPW4_9HELO|nr:uncharacterized protein PAC_04704 [Phialocephala subalpina]
MHLITFVYLLSTMLIAGVYAMTSGIEGYGLEDFTWEVETSPGGPKAHITGTVQEVVSQLLTINPNWKSDFNFSETPTRSTVLSRQLSFPWTGILCDIRIGEWGYADYYAIQDGITYLNGVPGIPTAGPGPGNCARVSCSYDSAIYWCNDETQTFSLPGFTTIAAGALVILDNCPDLGPGVNGQVFAQFLQNWNTIVRGDNC